MTASLGIAKEICAAMVVNPQQRPMTAPEFEARLVAWAQHRPDIVALVLGGSRALATGGADQWSDWDFHLITTNPRRYQCADWPAEIAPCWVARAQRTPRGFIKVSAVFAGGFETDFMPLAAWQMKLVYAAMAHPGQERWMPRRLVRGIQETRAFMRGSGYRLLVGEKDWQRRFKALDRDWSVPGLSAEHFAGQVAAFWQEAVWVFKKTAKPEPRSAMHWLHLLLVHHVYVLLAEEARLAGRPARSEARKSEQWLDQARLRQTAITTAPDQQVLARALGATIDLFQEVSAHVAAQRGFVPADYSAVAGWLRTELAKIAG